MIAGGAIIIAAGSVLQPEISIQLGFRPHRKAGRPPHSCRTWLSRRPLQNFRSTFSTCAAPVLRSLAPAIAAASTYI